MTGSYSTAETVVNRIGLCHKKPTDLNDFYTGKKGKETSFSKMSLEANSVHISPRYGLLNSANFKHFIEESAVRARKRFRGLGFKGSWFKV